MTRDQKKNLYLKKKIYLFWKILMKIRVYTKYDGLYVKQFIFSNGKSFWAHEIKIFIILSYISYMYNFIWKYFL